MKNKFILLLTAFCSLLMIADAQPIVDYNNVCVDSIWYEPTDPGLINVRVYNGDAVNMNYPSLQIVSPTGDTISNRSNYVTFFAQLTMTYTTYTDTIYEPGISDWTGYTFLMNELFGDTGGVIDFCSTTGINSLEDQGISIYPNPASDYIHLDCKSCAEATIHLLDNTGKIIREMDMKNELSVRISLAELPAGMYMVQIRKSGKNGNYRIMKY